MAYLQNHIEKFKETFSKPSQIYRFLRERWKESPFYLYRNLSYINKHRQRFSRLNRTKKVDFIAELLKKGVYTNIIYSNPRNNVCYFNWICDSETSQKTRSFGYICPWCDKDLLYLDSLMMHLRCSHSRFNFNLVEENNQAVIEVTLNPSFDGSYLGFKYPGHDLKRDFKFTPRHPERLRSDVCSGRLYYHTTTCLPIKPYELDLDSEADMDPMWLRERTQLMIDEFTDVNEGEKEILKLWNLHLMQNYEYKGDNMMRKACLDFVDREGQQILSKKLYKNFTLHLANLFDYGLISSGDILECVRKIKKPKNRAWNMK